MPSAILHESIASRSNVDTEKGIVTGCRLAEVGKLAVYAGKDGGRTEVIVTPDLIDGLLAICSEEERINAHWTHDWFLSDDDALKHRVATWRNFRKDDSGNLIADAFTAPGEKRDAILHWAENDPQGMMVSMIFDYSGGRDNPKAESVRSADFVAKGAATTALCQAVLSAIHKTASMADPTDPNPAPANPAPAAPLFTPEQEARINELIQAALNPPQIDDSTAPAMFAAIRKEVAARVGESENKVATLAEAAFTKKIGGTAILANLASAGRKDENPLKVAMTAHLAAMPSNAKNRGLAIARAIRDNPELEQHRDSLDA